ncbi:NACHT domain- and WD repeat-containing protein 1 [Oncorhynchus kisutch]|uniref:NACHT and WD repeat domain containing 1 n=1 Tax=Oncorhynchus kisutch TaxID=8019 RepID=A0A8C7FYE7_ONCKI|nr:NACHT domain- and WD repeat-containing protein 1 [Oncorhynchus kisutch]
MASPRGALMEVLKGQATEGLKLRSNVVRVFVSSTFTDMSSERNALLDKTYPELQAFCQSLGLVFEVVDMRWGLQDAIAVDHMTTELCLQEIEACRKVSVGPSFIALLGNRYGHRPIPRVLPGKQFEVLLSKLPQDQVGLLHQWFRKDNNAVPPVYVLQPITTLLPHYNDLQPERRPLQDDSVISWRYTEARLLQLLRTAAVQAEKDGDITVEQKHQFFKSVAEHEIEEGLRIPDGDESEPSAILFVRELPHLRKKDGPKRLAQYMDVTADGLLDTEAQELLSGLKSRLFAASPGMLNLHSVELCKGAIEPSCKEHAQYLESLCEQLVSQTKARIARRVGAGSSVEAGEVRTNGARGGDASQRKREEDSGWLLQELSHHMALSAGKCSGVFRGREGLLGKICLAMWEHTNTCHTPLVVHGPPGVGKTTLLCKLAQEMRGLLDPRAVVVLRLLGTSAESSDLGRVLQSVCFQICSVFSLSPPTPITAHTSEDLVRFFHGLLAEVSERGDTLLLILDSLDQLSSATQGQNLHWLPKDIPPNVHLVVSTADTGSPVLANLRRTVEVPGNFFEVEPLSCDQGREIMNAYMREAQRSLTPEQCEVVLCSFQLSGNPLHLKLLLDMARRWASYTPVTDLALSSSAQEVMSQLLQTLEERHGKQLVGAALGYIVSARGSLSEAELRDILSLDDNVLAEVYQYWLPPNHSLIRLPPLLWVRLRHDLGELLVEGQANGVTVLDFHHKLLTETVRERYQRSEQQADRHRVLAEYFLGSWSQGRFKAVLLPPLTTTLDADRKVPPQPLWFAEGVANVKKLQELPYHLLHAGLWEELRQEVIGSSEWLYCKTLTCGVASVIEDLTLCTKLMDCPETQLIRETFILLKPTLDFLDGQMDPPLFYTEVLARLHSFAEMYPSLIGRLCCQCHDWLSCCPDPILVPKCTFLQPPGGALKTTLAGFQKGVTALDICPERGILLAGSEDGKVIAWDLNDLEVIQTLVGHTAKVLSVRVIDSGAHCLSLAADGSLRKWSLLSGRQLYCTQEAVSINSLPSTTHIHVSEERALVFTHSGGQVKVWHLNTTELLFQVKDTGVSIILGFLNGMVVSLSDGGLVTFSHPSAEDKTAQIHLEKSSHSLTLTATLTLQRNGRLLIASKEGFLYQVSSTVQGRQSQWTLRQTVTELPVCATFLSASDDERILLAGCERTLVLFHRESDCVQSFLDLHHEDTVLCACVSGDSRVVVSGSEDQTIRVWSMTTGNLLDCFLGMDAPVTTLALYEGTVVSASSSAYYLKLWHLPSPNNPQQRPNCCIPAGCPQVALTKDGDTVYYVRNVGQKEVITWNCHTGSSADTMAVSAEVCCLELAQNKKLLFCGLTTGTVLIYPLAFPKETLCIPPPETLPTVRCMAIGGQEKHMAVAYEDSVCLFEITARDSFPSVEGPSARFSLSLLHSPVSSMALLPDCRLLYGTACGEVTMYDFKSASTATLDGHRSRVNCVTTSNWGTHALVGSEDAVQRLWGLTPLVLDHTMEYKGFLFEGVLCAAFSESDKHVFTGSQDRTIKVWDVASGSLLFVQYVYAPVTKMLTYRNGFVAISQLGYVIKEGFRCPDGVCPEYNPLRNVNAHYRVTSRQKSADSPHSVITEIPEYNPAQFNFMALMLKSKPSHSCQLL